MVTSSYLWLSPTQSCPRRLSTRSDRTSFSTASIQSFRVFQVLLEFHQVSHGEFEIWKTKWNEFKNANSKRSKMHGHLSEADVKNHCYSGLARQRKSLDGFQTDSKYLPLYSFSSVICHLNFSKKETHPSPLQARNCSGPGRGGWTVWEHNSGGLFHHP